MLGDFLNRLEKLEAKNVSASVPPSHFNDPIALETEWTGYPGGGQDYRLRKVSSTRWEFHRSGSLVLWVVLLIIVGLGILIIPAYHLPARLSEVGNPNFLVPVLMSVFFITTALLILGGSSKRLVFDKECGCLFKARGSANVGVGSSHPESRWELDRIHALQLIARHYIDPDATIRSKTTVYETNLVLVDASRLNVTAHGDLNATREEARALSDFLGKPLWDSI